MGDSFLNGAIREVSSNLDTLLAQLPIIRDGINANDFNNSLQKYSDLNTHGINLIRHLQQLANDKEMIRLSDAYTSLLWLRERAGQERAALIWVFTSGYINADYFRQLITYIESQETLLKSLNITVPQEYRQMLQQKLSLPVNDDVANFRDAAINKIVRNEIMNDLLSLIGYGGFIHYFKNYVIRGNTIELEHLRHLEEKVHVTVEKFKNVDGLNQEDFFHLAAIEDTLSRYFNLIDKITVLLQQDETVQAIDETVKVDDSPALQAILYFRKGLAGKDATLWWKISSERISLIKTVSDRLKMDISKRSAINMQSTANSLCFFISVTLITLMISLILGVFLGRRLVTELKNISSNMRRMYLERRLDQPLFVSGRDEISVMARTFNQLMNERQKFEAELRLSAEVFANISEAIMIANADKQIKMVNPAFIRVTGYSEEKVLGKDLLCLNENLMDKATVCQIWNQLLNDSQWQGEMWHKKPGGEKYLVWLNISVVRNNEGVITQYICMFTDITQRKQHEENIWYQANFDALTNLPNRKMCLDRLSENLMIAARMNTQTALLFIDMDRFKLINDTLGHKAGDELLLEVATRLKNSVRETDIVSRLGGDEFVIILTNILIIKYLSYISKKILTALSKPFYLEDNSETFTSGSIGITLFPQDGRDVETLMKKADTAMYQSKKIGRNKIVFFQEEMNHAAIQQLTIEQEIRNALTNHEFSLHYQPIIDLSTEHVIGAEALIRWHHPTQGLIYPDKFVGIAEDSGLIVPLGDWIIRTAAQQSLEWNNNSNQLLKISINISSRQFFDNGKHILKILKTVLRDALLRPGMLQIEITESLLMKDSPEIVDSLHQIRDMGIGISLDDFGTGFSSLNYLKHFPISAIKIDRLFVQDALINKKNAKLVQAMVMLSKSLEIDVIGEGIENAEQFVFLKKLRCKFGQGYYFARPMTAKDFKC
jgi:diguanylate cyclase (GGDEF)-like protein/PAS domain S-box-containing protein